MRPDGGSCHRIPFTSSGRLPSPLPAGLVPARPGVRRHHTIRPVCLRFSHIPPPPPLPHPPVPLCTLLTRTRVAEFRARPKPKSRSSSDLSLHLRRPRLHRKSHTEVLGGHGFLVDAFQPTLPLSPTVKSGGGNPTLTVTVWAWRGLKDRRQHQSSRPREVRVAAILQGRPRKCSIPCKEGRIVIYTFCDCDIDSYIHAKETFYKVK